MFPSHLRFLSIYILSCFIKMASSQIHIASSSTTFGYGLRDHNLRDQWSNRDSNAAAFRNLKDFVDSISGQPNKKSAPNVSQNDVNNNNTNNNKDNQSDPSDLWVHIPTYKIDENSNHAPQSNKCDDRLAMKRETNFSGDSMNHTNRGSSAPVSPVRRTVVPNNIGGVSSLVRRWRTFEAENSSTNSPVSSSRTTSVDSNNNINHNNNVSGGGDNESLLGMRCETKSMNEDTIGDWESDRPSLSGRESDATEKERTRVVDIIRKLTTPSTAGTNDENGNDQESSSPPVSLDSLMGSPRLRGHQALGDLLVQLQRDRHKELEGLVERKAVSKFSQKGRIQAMLRVQFLRRGAKEAKDLFTSSCTSMEVNRLPQSAIKRLSQRFKVVSQDSAPRLRTPEKEVINSSQVGKSISLKDIKDTNQQGAADLSQVGKYTYVQGIKCTNQQDDVDSSRVGKSIHVQEIKGTNQQCIANSSQVEKSTTVQDNKCTNQQNIAESSFEVRKSTAAHGIIGTNEQCVADSSQVGKSTSVQGIKYTNQQDVNQQNVADSFEVEKSTSFQDNKRIHRQEVALPASFKDKELENTKAKESLLKSGIVDRAAMSKNKNKKDEEKSILHPDNSGNVHEEACTESDILQKRPNEENKSYSLHRPEDKSFSSTAVKKVYSTEEHEKRLQPSGICHESMSCSIDLQENQQRSETCQLRRNDSVDTQCGWEKECSSNQCLSESEHGWVSDISHTQVGWEELHSDYEQQSDGMQDWICDISRPRSEWEVLRKERYQEMLDPFKQKEDIRRLLERKSVSSFLSSGLKDSIDRLMISRTQPKQFIHTCSQTDEQVTRKESEYKVRQEHEEVENVIEKAECGDAGYEQDDEGNDEDENQVEKQYEASVEYADQTSSALPFTSWNSIHGHETSEFSDQVGFSSLQQNSCSDSYSQESRTCSTMTNRCSIEMQLIYELRGHMERLHEEMSEIRKSIKSYMNKQLEFQRSFKHDVVATHSRSGQNRGRHSTQKKGLINRSMCCICYDEQVDCLLYRCGHMISCFVCAHELQRGSGRCPVCQAPIIDVVRVHSNS
ncbi:hypothetical protein LIER_19713 [Lithospermum erythrorhizon]|uniref:RING-type domain-containing protein n=1 Tax=Lithospermum erythrorhizon TaxID=34254 RepID=A0AAV3QMI4_LITER